MSHQTLELQARVYIYDLNNSANEHGFKADEGWQLSLANFSEKLDFEKKYYPTISTKVLPEILPELLGIVKSKLIPENHYKERELNDNDNSNSDRNYLIAFNPQRFR